MSPDQDVPIKVLPSGSNIGIFLDSVNENAYGDYLEKPDGLVVLQEDLYMVSGRKRGRHRMCDVQADLIIDTPTFAGIAMEAVACGVEPDVVELQENRLIVQVTSLNNALNIATRRLKPKRQSGGRVYSYLAFIYDRRAYSIEAIRKKVEAGKWEFPPN
ncbi:hypothetical protein [Microcoleus vaginatus]|uniref:hypothetical protein n=1 Tax=Microcoleus vaginatus TaxID=119532 RepID=UPI001F6100F1|nr:hypothetical protein D0A37_24375 [Microcoleus vaginatus HSN003]